MEEQLQEAVFPLHPQSCGVYPYLRGLFSDTFWHFPEDPLFPEPGRYLISGRRASDHIFRKCRQFFQKFSFAGDGDIRNDSLLQTGCVSNLFHIGADSRDQILLNDLCHSAGFNVKCFHIVFKLDLIAGIKFGFCKNFMSDQKLFIFSITCKMRQSIRCGNQIIKSTRLRLP